MALPDYGSQDIEQIHLHVAGLDTDTEAVKLKRGNKFIVVEHMISPDGAVLDETQFDVQRMCYSLFAFPLQHDSAINLHREILGYYRLKSVIRGNIGRIMGGGVLNVFNDKVYLHEYSQDYQGVPEYIRYQFSEKIVETLRERLGNTQLQVNPMEEQDDHAKYFDIWVNIAWMQFSQVAQAASALEDPEYVRDLQKSYKDLQKAER